MYPLFKIFQIHARKNVLVDTITDQIFNNICFVKNFFLEYGHLCFKSVCTFRRNKNDYKNLIETCRENNIVPTKPIFKRTNLEREEICSIYEELLHESPISASFNKEPDEVRKIVELMIEYLI